MNDINTKIEELSDIQSESGIIGTLIYHPEFVLHTDYLKPNYFYGVENGCCYWAIQELYREGITNIDAYNIITTNFHYYFSSLFNVSLKNVPS